MHKKMHPGSFFKKKSTGESECLCMDGKAELQKRANRANQLVLFFLAGANFWEKHAKTGEKQALFWC